jgi:hypothetical protein
MGLPATTRPLVVASPMPRTVNSFDKRGGTARAGSRLHAMQAIGEQRSDRCPVAVRGRPATGEKERRQTSVSLWKDRAVDGRVFNSSGTYVGVVRENAVHDLKGHKLYELKGTNIYRLSGELVGRLEGRSGADVRLSKSMDALF